MRNTRFATAALLLAVAAPAQAQDLEYTTRTTVSFQGALGAVMRMMGEGGETVEKNYLKGAKMRADGKDESTIMDLETGRFIAIDHKKKTYMIMTFDQILSMSQDAIADAQTQMQEQQTQMEKPEADVDLKYEVDVEPTDEHEKINGYDARRYYMTMRTEVTVTPEGGDAQQSGDLVLLQDTWNARDVPIEAALKAFQEKAPQLAEQTMASTDGLSGAFAARPELREALAEASKKAQEVEGFPMRNTTYMILVPEGAEFDRGAVLAAADKGDEDSGGGIGGMLKKGLGIGGRSSSQKPSETPKLFTLAKITTETMDVRTASLSDDLFEPPAGYTEKPMPTMGGK